MIAGIPLTGKTSIPQNEDNRIVKAARTQNPPVIDGELNDLEWGDAPVITDLVQKEPDQGEPATEQSEIRVLYNDEAIYVGARLYDSAPDSIVARLSRRDSYTSSDQFTIYFDPYNNNQSGFYFGVNAAGTKYDGTLYNDHGRSDSWDGVWESEVRIDSTGWIVEMRIPFSQLRFQKKERYVWGMNVERVIARKNEENFLKFAPRDASGFVSYFPKLEGIHNVNPPNYFEIEPYLTTKASYLNHTSGNPFYDGSAYNLNAGFDIRTSVFQDLMLNATVNPDFGQVEVDPAVVNLSDVETFYPEKRPFFIDGSNYFNYGESALSINLNINWPSPNFYYSRRIGEQPDGSVPAADYVDYPDATNIIGAGKITGQTEGNWNIGVMQAVTAREKAEISTDGDISSVSVHPPSYYSIGRVEKQFNDSRSNVGMMATYTRRDIRRNALEDEMNESAVFVGGDGYTFLDRNLNYIVSGWMGASRVTGTQKRMIRLQRNPVHYMQRPDLMSSSVDSNATAMNGYGGKINIAKQKGNFLFLASFGMLSPGFELNDAGYLPYTNVVNSVGTVGYHWTEPTRWYRRMLIAGAFFSNQDFDGTNTGKGFWGSYQLNLPNYYRLNINMFKSLRSFDNRLTRGGPLTLDKGGTKIDVNFSSDRRKDLIVELGGTISRDNDGSRQRAVSTEFTWKPSSNVSVSVEPRYQWNYKKAHYLNSFNDPLATSTYGKRYVFAELDQHTVSSRMRINWTFTPKLSLQMYAQPLISSGSYSNFKELEQPKSFDFMIYGEEGSTYDPESNTADPDGEGKAPSLRLSDPDFNYRSLRGNAVLRWQYNPGSTIYFVWTQSRSMVAKMHRLEFSDSFSELIGTHPDNIFLLKFTYWFNMGG